MYKRKDGLWCEKVTIHGKQKYFYGKTKSEVIAKMRNYHDGMKVSDAVREWWNAKEGELSPNTTPSYIRFAKRFACRFEGAYISDITPKDISDFMDSQISEYKMSHKTASNCLAVANSICSYAIGNGWIQSNPCRDIKLKRDLPSSKRPLPSDEDIDTISRIDELTLANFILFTGLRRGEVIALRWDDIDMKKRIIHVHHGVYFASNEAREKATKTEAGERDVPIPGKLYALLEYSDGYVFKSRCGGMLSNSEARHAWEHLQKRYGFTCTPHQLRHAYTALIVDNAGLSFADAAGILGHSDSSTTSRVYYGLREKRKNETIAKLHNLDV